MWQVFPELLHLRHRARKCAQLLPTNLSFYSNQKLMHKQATKLYIFTPDQSLNTCEIGTSRSMCSQMEPTRKTSTSKRRPHHNGLFCFQLSRFQVEKPRCSCIDVAGTTKSLEVTVNTRIADVEPSTVAPAVAPVFTQGLVAGGVFHRMEVVVQQEILANQNSVVFYKKGVGIMVPCSLPNQLLSRRLKICLTWEM